MRQCIVSFPKSGRTWLRHMLEDIKIDPDASHAGSSHTEALTAEELGTDLAGEFDQILLLTRDPRDTAVSGYHWCRTKKARTEDDPPYEGSLSEFLRDPRHGIEKIARFNLMWSQLERDNIRLLTYEDLRADTTQCLKQVAQFFAGTVSDRAIQKAIADNSLAAMQKRETEKRLTKHRQHAIDPNSLKARKGIVGGHKAEIGPEDALYCEEVLERLGYFKQMQRALAQRRNLAFGLHTADAEQT